jgi:hypothetical protein
MKANFKEGFRRVFLLVYGCWIVSCVFYLFLYRPVTEALAEPQREWKGVDYEYTRCKMQAAAAQAE